MPPDQSDPLSCQNLTSSSTSTTNETHILPTSPFTLPPIISEADFQTKQLTFRKTSSKTDSKAKRLALRNEDLNMSSLSELGARHQQIIAAVIKNLAHTSVDWDVVAKEAECSSGKYARDEYHKVQKKLNGGLAPKAANGTPGTASKKTATPRKRKIASDGDDDEATPSKSAKKSKGKKAGSSVADQDDEENTKATKIKPETNGDEDDDEDLL